MDEEQKDTVNSEIDKKLQQSYKFMFDENPNGRFYRFRKQGYLLLISLSSLYTDLNQIQKQQHIRRFIRFCYDIQMNMMQKYVEDY